MPCPARPSPPISTAMARHTSSPRSRPAPSRPTWVLDRFALALYPVVNAGRGAEVGLSPAQWRQLGAALARVHATPQTPELTRLVGREGFWPSRRELLRELEAVVAGPTGDDPVAGELAAFWQAGKDVIDALVDRADRLGRQAARAPSQHVLCRADLHTWNVLVDGGGQLWIVDWDEAVLAPPERDLMFVVGGIGHGLVGPSDTKHFFEPGNIVELARRSPLPAGPVP
jgi:spectinomycin phosphotransferase